MTTKSTITLYVTPEQLEILTDALEFSFSNDGDRLYSGEEFDDLHDKLAIRAATRSNRPVSGA
jgi:hypothetical protein